MLSLCARKHATNETQGIQEHFILLREANISAVVDSAAADTPDHAVQKMALPVPLDSLVEPTLKPLMGLEAFGFTNTLLEPDSLRAAALLSALHPLECPMRAALLFEPILLPSGITVSKSAIGQLPSSVKTWVGPPPGVHFVLGAPDGPDADSQKVTVAVTSLLQGALSSSQGLAEKCLLAKKALVGGDIAAASAAFRAALQMAEGGAGGSHEALLGLAQCASAAGDPEGALARAQRAVTASPPHWPDAGWAHARFALQMGDKLAASGSAARALVASALREALLRGLLARGYAAQPDALAESLPAFIQFDEADAEAQPAAEDAPSRDHRTPPALQLFSSLQAADIKVLQQVLPVPAQAEDAADAAAAPAAGAAAASPAPAAFLAALVDASTSAEQFINELAVGTPGSFAAEQGAAAAPSAAASGGEGGAIDSKTPPPAPRAAKRPRSGSSDEAANVDEECAVEAAQDAAPADAPAVAPAAEWRRGVLSAAVAEGSTLSIPRPLVAEALMCALSCTVLFQPVSPLLLSAPSPCKRSPLHKIVFADHCPVWPLFHKRHVIAGTGPHAAMPVL